MSHSGTGRDMPTTVADLLADAERLLDAHAFNDYCPIGLQVAGRTEDVTAIATAVSCTRDVFERAVAVGAQVLLVHHGLFWKGMSQVVDATMRDRLAILFDAGITLAGYHLPLDAHAEIGNNALLANALELQRTPTPFAVHGGRAIGLVGEYAGDGIDQSAFTARVAEVLEGREPLVLGAAPAGRIRRVAISSGGSASNIAEAAALGCDAFITGEPREDTRAFALELGIAFYAAGHHATERGGIRALGEHLARTHDLRHEFLDVDNPV